MTITAKYPGKCACCGLPISVGSKIEWSKGAAARHVACGPVSAVPARRVSAGYTRRPYGATRACRTGGNCSSFGDGSSCGGHDCDGY